MATLQVYLNDKEVCKARHTGKGNVSFHMTIDNHLGREKIDFEVSGMQEGKEGRFLLDWIVDQNLRVGDEIKIKVVDGLCSDNPWNKLDWSQL